MVFSLHSPSSLPIISLGWVNPAIYALSSATFKDITDGSNACVALGRVCCAQGFKATKGWDPVTGLGAVNFASFRQQLVSLGPGGTPTRVPTKAPSVSPTKRPVGPTRTPTRMPSGPTKAPSYLPSIR
ncbi:hypothetical protein EON64_03955, partial [archaeon]